MLDYKYCPTFFIFREFRFTSEVPIRLDYHGKHVSMDQVWKFLFCFFWGVLTPSSSAQGFLLVLCSEFTPAGFWASYVYRGLNLDWLHAQQVLYPLYYLSGSGFVHFVQICFTNYFSKWALFFPTL